MVSGVAADVYRQPETHQVRSGRVPERRSSLPTSTPSVWNVQTASARIPTCPSAAKPEFLYADWSAFAWKIACKTYRCPDVLTRRKKLQAANLRLKSILLKHDA